MPVRAFGFTLMPDRAGDGQVKLIDVLFKAQLRFDTLAVGLDSAFLLG